MISPQMAVLAAETTSPIDIATSTVNVDLNAIYGAKVSKQLPSVENGDPYGDFKYLTQMARKGSMYFYFVFTSNTPVKSAVLTYNDSTTDTPNEKSANLSFMSKEGSYITFYKFKVDSLYTWSPTATDGTQKHHFRALSLTGKDEKGNTLFSKYDCRGSDYSWVDEQENSSQVYEFYQDNYIVINDSNITTEIIPTAFSTQGSPYNWGTNVTYPNTADELHWLFFSPSSYKTDNAAAYSLDHLKKVTYRYYLTTYTARYFFDQRAFSTTSYKDLKFDQYGVSDSLNTTMFMYSGIYSSKNDDHLTSYVDTMNKATDGAHFEWPSYNNVITEGPKVKTKEADTSVKTDEVSSKYGTGFWPWEKQNTTVSYTYKDIVKLDKTSIENAVVEVSSSTYDVKSKMRNFLEERIGSYDWAVCIDKTVRKTVIKSHYENLADSWWFHAQVDTDCHDIKDASFTTLTFNNNNVDFNLNAIMSPVSTSGTQIVEGNMTTVTDRNLSLLGIVNKTTNLLDFLWNTFSTATKILAVGGMVAGTAFIGYWMFIAFRNLIGYTKRSSPKKKESSD